MIVIMIAMIFVIIIYVSSNRKQTHDDDEHDDRDGNDQILSYRDLKAAVQKYTAVHTTWENVWKLFIDSTLSVTSSQKADKKQHCVSLAVKSLFCDFCQKWQGIKRQA